MGLYIPLAIDGTAIAIARIVIAVAFRKLPFHDFRDDVRALLDDLPAYIAAGERQADHDLVNNLGVDQTP